MSESKKNCQCRHCRNKCPSLSCVKGVEKLVDLRATALLTNPTLTGNPPPLGPFLSFNAAIIAGKGITLVGFSESDAVITPAYQNANGNGSPLFSAVYTQNMTFIFDVPFAGRP